MSLYGDYPWLDKELNIDSEELYAERTPRATVMENVLADLDYACENLPDDWEDGNAPGRLNRWCALLVKSRICLFEGTWRKYHQDGGDVNAWLQEAADAAKELIDNGPYQLYSKGDPNHDYNAIFQMNDLSGVDEVMYWRRYQQGFSSKFMADILLYVMCNKKCSRRLFMYRWTTITLSGLYKGDEIYEIFLKTGTLA